MSARERRGAWGRGTDRVGTGPGDPAGPGDPLDPRDPAGTLDLSGDDVLVPEPLELSARDRAAGSDREELLPAVVDALPGVARLAASTAYHTAAWGVGAYARTGRRLLRAAVDRDEAKALRRDVGEAAGAVAGLARALQAGVPLPQAVASLGDTVQEWVEPVVPASRQVPEDVRPPRDVLRDRGQELLRRSRDVWDTDTQHPAYERILGELAPDEARILVLLLKDGPQPSVDVRTGGPVGMVSSHLVAPGLTMIGARAGVRYLDQVPNYLNNLFRLGLVWLSKEPLSDPLRYQVLEAQPDVLEALHSVRFARVVRRSTHLTPFGEDFARRCFLSALEAGDADSGVVALPSHTAPPDSAPGPAEPPALG